MNQRKTTWSLCALVFTTLTILSACSKDKPETEYDVYVAGYEFNGSVDVAKLWKNGEVQDLTNGTSHAYATSVFVVPRN